MKDILLMSNNVILNIRTMDNMLEIGFNNMRHCIPTKDVKVEQFQTLISLMEFAVQEIKAGRY